MTTTDEDFMRLAEFGCFTGDCPHTFQTQCEEAIKQDWLRQHKCIDELEAMLRGSADLIDQQAKRLQELSEGSNEGYKMRLATESENRTLKARIAELEADVKYWENNGE